jgi:hypothetical protein
MSDFLYSILKSFFIFINIIVYKYIYRSILFIRSYNYCYLTSSLKSDRFVNLPLQNSFSSVLYSFGVFITSSSFLALSLLLSKVIIITSLSLILLSGFVDSLNKVLGRRPINDEFIGQYAARHLKGNNNNRIVDLSFFNVGQLMNNPTPTRPGKIIFDKNDREGSLLPLLFPENRGHMCLFLRNGVAYRGISHPRFGTGGIEAGVLERIDSNTYHISVEEPNPVIIQEFNLRSIFVVSRNLPLVHIEHITTSATGSEERARYIYIYANRTDAIGVFDPNDSNILPSSVVPPR